MNNQLLEGAAKRMRIWLLLSHEERHKTALRKFARRSYIDTNTLPRILVKRLPGFRDIIAADELFPFAHPANTWFYRQRAFRERKERHVKDLEAKLAGLEAAQQQSSIENERLKRDLQKISTENEILRATSHTGHGSISPEPATGPLRFKPTDFYSNVLQNHTNKSPSHRIVTSDDGERLLAAGATWDFIISHELFKKGLVDIADVSERLKNCARCDGQGPVFSERSITNAIEQSVASGTDDLLWTTNEAQKGPFGRNDIYMASSWLTYIT
jgi:hypothetical protein